jgi:hypothetical protein
MDFGIHSMYPVLNKFSDIQAFAKISVRHLRITEKILHKGLFTWWGQPHAEPQTWRTRLRYLCPSATGWLDYAPRSPGGSGTSGLPLPVPTYVGPWGDNDIKDVLNYNKTSKSTLLHFIIRCGQMEQEMVCGVMWPWMLQSWGLVRHMRGLRITHT